jgi:hypothetical protein
MYKTTMTEFPTSCLECKLVMCRKPEGKSGDFQNEYRHRRHEECPLTKVKKRDED